MGRRLADINARKREERLQDDENKLDNLIEIREFYSNGRMDEFKRQLRQHTISNREELEV